MTGSNFKQATYALPRGRITAVEGPDGAEVEIEMFDTPFWGIRPMRDFDQALRCARDIAAYAWSRE